MFHQKFSGKKKKKIYPPRSPNTPTPSADTAAKHAMPEEEARCASPPAWQITRKNNARLQFRQRPGPAKTTLDSNSSLGRVLQKLRPTPIPI